MRLIRCFRSTCLAPHALSWSDVIRLWTLWAWQYSPCRQSCSFILWSYAQPRPPQTGAHIHNQPTNRANEQKSQTTKTLSSKDKKHVDKHVVSHRIEENTRLIHIETNWIHLGVFAKCILGLWQYRVGMSNNKDTSFWCSYRTAMVQKWQCLGY